MINQATTVACGCTATISTLCGYLWVGGILIGIMVVTTAVDIYHIWQRCNERKARLAAMRESRVRREDNGGISKESV
jgi:hypothetical protein